MPIEAQYQNDAALLEAMPSEEMAEFEVWLGEIEKLMDGLGRPYGDGSLPETTGIECWCVSYRNGMTPQEALDEDMSYWE